MGPVLCRMPFREDPFFAEGRGHGSGHGAGAGLGAYRAVQCVEAECCEPVFNQNWTDLVSNFGPGTALGRSRDVSGERCRILTRPGRPPGVLEAPPRSYLLYSIENKRF